MSGARPIAESSPGATGPAGPQFEAKVGTHYALALLACTDPFGLPGVVVDRLEFQRGGQAHLVCPHKADEIATLLPATFLNLRTTMGRSNRVGRTRRRRWICEGDAQLASWRNV
jgi:hypothetical protein